MVKLYSATLFLSLCLCFSSCKKETTTTVIDFSNYTATDTNCTNLTVDATDWGYDSTWTGQESALLLFKDSVSKADSIGGLVEVSPACPNPVDSVFIVGTNTSKSCRMKYAFVNTEMQLLHYGSKQCGGGPFFTVFDFRNVTSFHKGQNYRMYYAFYLRNDSIIHKGHGDIRIE